MTRDPKANNKEPFFRVYESVLRNEKFNSMSANAQMLYIRMGARSYQDNERHLWCTFPRSEQLKQHIRTNTFVNARNELLENGFIEQRTFTDSGLTVCYKLSDNWFKYDGPVPKDNQYY